VTNSRRLAYLALTANAVIWGAAFPIIKPALEYLSATQYLYLRFLVAGLFALPIFLYYYFKKHPKLSYLLKVLLFEVVGTIFPLLLLYQGLATTSALEASLIGATGPIFVVLGGIWFLRERETRREWQGFALSLAGSLIIILEPLWNGHALAGSSLTGNLLVLSYNLLYAAYALTAKRFYRHSPPLAVGPLTYLTCAALYALMLNHDQSLPNLTQFLEPKVTLAVLYMALPGTVLAFIFYLYAQSRIEVSEANLFTYLNGVVAIPTAYFLLGETPTPISLVGITIIALGVYLAESRTRRKRSRRL